MESTDDESRIMSKSKLLSSENPDLSIVIPCLNEEDTLGKCISKLLTVAKEEQFTIEVIVADNGSKDGSIDIAKSYNTKVVNVSQKGYGAALMGGIDSAKSEYILMADADDSYNFLDTPKFYQKIKEGFDLVQGCRLPNGGGKIENGAMPWSHRYIGNPLFTYLVRSWFGSPIHDVYCGMRAFRKSFYESLKMKCTGMEFATEMIIKGTIVGSKIEEVPITLHKDGRIQHPPHLRTIRDGWKTLCFFILLAPIKLFLVPGALMIFLGSTGTYFGYTETSFNGISIGAHTMLGSSLLIIIGYQSILMHLLCSEISTRIGIKPKIKEGNIGKLFLRNTTRLSLVALVIGIFLWAKIFLLWYSIDFGPLDYSYTMKIVIPGATLITLSMETFIFNFFRSWMKIEIR
jgi:glycosyltransferase involved in cell wall biosynthesis